MQYTTRKACPEPIMEQETAYAEALAAAETYEASDDQLILYDSGGNAVAVFSTVSQDLAGTAWLVVGYNNGTGGVVSVQLDTKITAALGEDGQLAGNAGCNEYFGPYETEDDNITMGPFGTTSKLWPGAIHRLISAQLMKCPRNLRSGIEERGPNR